MGAHYLIAIASIGLSLSPASSSAQSHQTLSLTDTLTDEQPVSGFGYERLSDILQYNRVQGLSLGVGYRLVPGAGSAELFTTARYGLSDERITGRLTLVRHLSRGEWRLSGFSQIADLDPFSKGLSFTNTLNALFVAHDNGHYAFVQGGSAALEIIVGPTLELSLSAGLQRETSAASVAQSEINDFLGGDGIFPANPPVREMTRGMVAVGLSGFQRYRWKLTADLSLGAGRILPRLYGSIQRSFGWRHSVSVRARAGVGAEPALAQTMFRLGGLSTVRGFEYGTVRAPAFWSAQLDLAPIGMRTRPVIFIDAGQAAGVSRLFSSTAFIGGGIGLSLLNGLVRLDLSRPLSPDRGRKLRFDIVVQGLQ
jgi:hypothetical protein